VAEIREITELNFNEGTLSELLIDAVDSGASVGFLAPLQLNDAIDYWQKVRRTLGNGVVLLGAFVDGRLVGSVQLALATQANAAHRAEVQKLFVLREFQKRGIAAQLMAMLEDKAKERGRALLVLDTRLGDTAERLYSRIGYQRVGVIPEFAMSSDGRLDGTVIFYKRVGS
jgi:acetyltransferase